MYSLFTSDFEPLVLHQNDNYEVKVTKQKRSNLCKSKGSNSRIMEAFQDQMDKEAKAANSIFCEPLNGHLVDFPKTMDEYKEIYDFQISTMKRKTLNEMSITLDARTFAVIAEKPDIIKFDGRKSNLSEIGLSSKINPVTEVMNFISKAQKSYQTKEELCFILTTTLYENSTESLNNSILTNQMCNTYGDWWTVCQFDKPISLSLAGLCSDSPVDLIYSLVRPSEEKNRFGTFVGTTGWVIQYNSTLKTWTIAHYAYKDKDLKLLDSNRRPFGKQTWLVKNDVCNKGEDSSTKLLLSSCDDDQFTCDDGTCVAIEFRCDKKPDCMDISDEKECRTVAFDEERYKPDEAAPSLKEGSKLEVTLGVMIQNILNIIEVQKIISLKFRLEQKWRDSRLQYYNLKKDEELNTLTLSEKKKIWVPTILFSNTREDFTSKNDKQAFAKVKQFNKGSLLGLETNEDILVYKGSENEIKINRIYEIDFLCDYDMRYYPFDIQVCTLDLVIDGTTAKFIDLVPGNLTYSGSTDLAQYYIMDQQIYSTGIKGKQGVQVSITLGRRLLGTILTVYVPTVLLNIIGHATNYFKDFFFEAVVTINLTCMLVLVTLFISVSDSLPQTSYLKMMDFWLIFNLTLPFIEVLLHTYIEALNEDDITKAAKEKDNDEVTYILKKILDAFNLSDLSRGNIFIV